jgi:hypothetical protein
MRARWIAVGIAGVLLAGCARDDADGSWDPLDAGSKPPDAGPLTCPDDYVDCGIFDGGWNVVCENGQIIAQDLSYVAYCIPGDWSNPVCYTGMDDPPYLVDVCPTGCLTEGYGVFIETSWEYSEFDFAALCAVPTPVDAAVDASDIDAGAR